MYDIAILGAGPAGLSAAINAASEGYKVVLIDAKEYGGQCGQSSNIENYAGFPDGITGRELAERMVCQADKFKVDFKCPLEIAYIEKNNNGFKMGDGVEEIESKIIIISTGVTYKHLPANGISRFIGAGVYYGSPSLSSIYKNENIVIVGGANSAGQAAFHLSKMEGINIKLIIRANSIEEGMSTYLVDKIKDCSNVEILCNTNVREAIGDTEIRSIIIEREGKEEEIKVDKIFILIGGNPNTYWLKELVRRDKNGFIETGGENLLEMETSEGIFVAGDVRAGSIKRVATAVGEGGSVVNNIHKYFANEKVLTNH